MSSALSGKRTTLVALLAALALAAMPATSGTVPRQAPDLTMKTADGRPVSLGKLRGKVVAVMWISTDCPHCQETCEALGPVYRELAGKGFEIMAMAVNPGAPGNIDKFRASHSVEFPLGVSTRSEWMRFADLSVMARAYVPYLLLVDRAGIIRYEHRGMDQAFWSNQITNLRRELDTLLAEPAGASR